MDLLLHSIQLDWPVLLPILLCSILVVAVVINRFSYYSKNKRDVVLLIPKFCRRLFFRRICATNFHKFNTYMANTERPVSAQQRCPMRALAFGMRQTLLYRSRLWASKSTCAGKVNLICVWGFVLGGFAVQGAAKPAVSRL